MVDLPLMNRLLDGTARNAALVLVGDPDQLPSVEAGALLGDLLRGDVRAAREGRHGPLHGAVVTLSRVYRSDTAILEAASAIREGDFDSLMKQLLDEAVSGGGTQALREHRNPWPASSRPLSGIIVAAGLWCRAGMDEGLKAPSDRSTCYGRPYAPAPGSLGCAGDERKGFLPYRRVCSGLSGHAGDDYGQRQAPKPLERRSGYGRTPRESAQGCSGRTGRRTGVPPGRSARMGTRMAADHTQESGFGVRYGECASSSGIIGDHHPGTALHGVHQGQAQGTPCTPIRTRSRTPWTGRCRRHSRIQDWAAG